MQKPNWLWVLIAGTVLISACAGVPAEQRIASGPLRQSNLRPPEGVQEFVKNDPASRSSLWREALYRDLFQDLRASRIGDLITVNIVETSQATKKADTKTGRESSINAGISNAMGWESKLKKLGVPSYFSNETMFKANMANDFTGSGETSRDESMTASITVRVSDVLPNGTLYIRGSREVKVNNEVQYITISGLIRPTDISPDNTVLSSYIADAKISYTGKGPVSDKQRPGWLTRGLDFIWPF